MVSFHTAMRKYIHSFLHPTYHIEYFSAFYLGGNILHPVYLFGGGSVILPTPVMSQGCAWWFPPLCEQGQRHSRSFLLHRLQRAREQQPASAFWPAAHLPSLISKSARHYGWMALLVKQPYHSAVALITSLVPLTCARSHILPPPQSCTFSSACRAQRLLPPHSLYSALPLMLTYVASTVLQRLFCLPCYRYAAALHCL
jgi:hypothetical protein